MIGVETYAAYGTDLGIFSVITWIYTYQICEMYSRSGFLCFGWHADHVISVINMQYKAHALWLQKINQKQQIDKDKPQWKKVKLTSLWLPFLSKGYTCVRKIYSVAVRIKTLLPNRFLTFKTVFEFVSIRCRRFRNSVCPQSMVPVLACGSWHNSNNFSPYLTTVRGMGCWFNWVLSQLSTKEFRTSLRFTADCPS